MNGPVRDEPLGQLELVHTFTGAMPTGVSISHTGRIFVSFPRWGDEVPATVVELRDGREVPFPGEAWNSPANEDDPTAFVSVQSVVVDPAGGGSWRRLHDHPSTWAEPLSGFRPVVEGRPFLERPPDGPPKPMSTGADGIAVSTDGARLHYCPLASRRWYSVAADALVDRTLDDAEVATTVVDEGDKGGGSNCLEADDAGRLYLTSYEHNAVLRRRPDGGYETVAHDPRLRWPDTMSVAADGYLYVTANQSHRQPKYQRGQDLRRKPYALFRVRIDAGPVRLR